MAKHLPLAPNFWLMKQSQRTKLRLWLIRYRLLWLARLVYMTPGTILGWIWWHFMPRKQFVIVLSSMRSGSTLLKALLAEAPDIEQIPEADFQIPGNRFYVYSRLYKLSTYPIVILKHPSSYFDFRTYPRLPKGDFKLIRLARNPLDTILSLQKMNKALGEEKSNEELIDYWCTTYENLSGVQHPHLIDVTYEKLVAQPLVVTKRLFQFIGSVQKKGVDHYHKPATYEWTWKKDDGGEIIRSLKVQKVHKDYTAHCHLIELLRSEPRIQSLMALYQLEWPQ